MPNGSQLKTLYRISYWLTYIMLQPIHLICVDKRSKNVLMEPVDYAAMSDKVLRQYFLAHRQDGAAFHAYMDRLNARPRQPIARYDDPDFGEKIQAAVLRQLADAAAEEN